MTVQGELDTGDAQVEFILCVEGLGFPDRPFATADFYGDVFVTGDLNGNLQSLLRGGSGNCTIHPGLHLPNEVSDALDMRTLEYSPSGLDFSIIDHDDVLLGAWLPLDPTGQNKIITSAFAFDSTTIRVNESAYAVAAGDLLWVGGKELIKVKTRANVAGSTYDYTTSFRGYMGTRQGNYDPRNVDVGSFAWPVGTHVYKKAPRWKDRKVVLYMHVPGEARANLVRIYSGIISDMQLRDIALEWQVSTVAELCPAVRRTPLTASGHAVYNHYMIQNQTIGSDGTWIGPPGVPQSHGSTGGGSDPIYANSWDAAVISDAHRAVLRVQPPSGETLFDRLGLIFAYNYRRQPGGTLGAYTNIAADEADPLTYEDTIGDYSRYFVEGVWAIDGTLIYVEYKEPEDLAVYERNYTSVVIKAIAPELGENFAGKFEEGATVRYLLDNVSGTFVHNRMSFDKAKKRNPVDVLLMFLTSTPGEYQTFATDALGTTILATKAGGGIGTAGLFDGYALHGADKTNDSDNWTYARKISTQTDTAVNFAAADAFNTATQNGATFHIRNTIYDVLPLPFALGVHNSEIDLSSFETVRDLYMPNAQVGTFAVGEEDDDLWTILQENICKPYGLVLYQDRSTGKLSLKYIPPFTDVDGVLNEGHTSVSDSQILSIEDLQLMPEVPAVEYTLRYRGKGKIGVNPIFDRTGPRPVLTGYEQRTVAGASMGSKGNVITIRMPDKMLSQPKDQWSTEQIDAMFHDADTISHLAALLTGRLVAGSREIASTAIHLDMTFIPKVQVGDVLKVTSTSISPIDPSTGTRGWADVLCRITGTAISLDPARPGVVCQVRVLGGTTPVVPMVAPACNVTSKGTHGGGPEYFAINLNDFSDQPFEDWNGLVVADLIELRDINGALKEAETIESFGANEASTPGDASTDTVNVVGSIASAIVAGDYITFAPYVTATVTSNMAKYAYHADSSDTLDASDGQVYA